MRRCPARSPSAIKAQKALSEANQELEKRVEERTAELRRAMERESAARIEAEEQSRLKEEFLAVVSHELRTPLNAIYGWSELLSRSGVSAVTIAEGLAAIRRNAKAQARLIEDLLDMSRITSSKTRLDAQPVNLSEVVAAAVQTAQPAAAAAGLRLDTVIGGGAHCRPGAWVMGDYRPAAADHRQPAEQRHQVHAARRHGDRAGARRAPGKWKWRCRIPGRASIPSSCRISSTSSARRTAPPRAAFGGLGLGLSIVRQLVELHGGRVRAESAGPGRGASFAVALPLTTAAGRAQRCRGRITAGSRHGRHRAEPRRRRAGRLARAVRGRRARRPAVAATHPERKQASRHAGRVVPTRRSH